MTTNKTQQLIDGDGDKYEVKVCRQLNRDFISILLNGVDEVTFRAEDAERIMAMIGTAAKAVSAAHSRPGHWITVEEAVEVSDLDALAIGSVVVDAHGEQFQRVEDDEGKGAGIWSGNGVFASSKYLALPALVVVPGGKNAK